MEIKELTHEEIHTLTLEQKDRWWLENIYRGDMPQLNLRSAFTGMLIGGVLSLTNLYVGIKTGWTLGVGITSVVLSFSAFKLLSKMKIGNEMSILENNAMQSIATSAGYMTSPLISAMPAYMLVTGKVVPLWQTMIWIILLSILGVLYAFPLKKRYINDEQMPFPEGYAAGVVLAGLHSEKGGKEGVFKGKILAYFASLAAFIEFIRNEKVMESLRLSFLKLPEHWDDFVYRFWTPTILGTPLKNLTMQFETSIIMMATGGLMGVKVGGSMLIGAFVNYAILAPALIQQGVIPGASFKQITMWSLWTGASMMTVGSLYSFFAKPQVIIASFKKLFEKKSEGKDVLKEIELPLSVSVIGIPVIGFIIVILAKAFFDIEYWHAAVAIPLIFVFTLIAVTSTGLTSITPGGALGKLTQLTYAVLAPGNTPTNIMSAGINSTVSLNASNLLMDIKPGYMLGAKPRQQAIGHVLGIFAGAVISVPVFYMIFNGNISLFTSETLPMPSVMVWKAVADALSQGLSALHPTVKIAVSVGAILAIFIEFMNQRMRGKFPISTMGLGLAFVLRFTDSFAMGFGAILFWYFEKKLKNPETTAYRVLVENKETACAGVIAGGSIIGIILIILETVVLK